MRTEQETVWKADNGDVLLRRAADGTFNVVLAFCKPEKLRELGNAITEALPKPLEAMLDEAVKK